MQSNTPGPWKVRETETTFDIRSEDGMRVLSTSWHSTMRRPYPLRDEAEANARLAAAAPSMQAALLALIAEPYGCHFCDSGKLRTAEKGHDDTCGYLLAAKALALSV